MNEIEYERMQEAAGMGEHCLECLNAIFADQSEGAVASVAELASVIYSNVPCGPWMAVRLHDGTVVYSDQLESVKNGSVGAILVGSMVEGSEAEIAADYIDLSQCESPEDAVARFNEAVEWVNAEVFSFWADDYDDDRFPDGFPPDCICPECSGDL